MCGLLTDTIINDDTVIFGEISELVKKLRSLKGNNC